MNDSTEAKGKPSGLAKAKTKVVAIGSKSGNEPAPAEKAATAPSQPQGTQKTSDDLSFHAAGKPSTKPSVSAARESKLSEQPARPAAKATAKTPKVPKSQDAPASTRSPSPREAKAAGRTASSGQAQLPSQETIDEMVAEAAYYLAEKRNFAPGFEEEDWLTAKAQIMAQLQGAKNPLE